MNNYNELIKRLREDVPTALVNCDFDFVEDWSKEAANAIEELLTLKALSDAKIEKLESTKTKKKKPPKRLPCTCGRKRLELWWSSNPNDKGWFLKCPNCGRQSQPERYQSRVNFAWNKGLSEPLKEE